MLEAVAGQLPEGLRAYLGSFEHDDEKGKHEELKAGIELSFAVLP
jgi:hypothetical protein